ncbi:uncharacterized protein LOC128773014 isoform X1 [Panthera pardus]|uniref:Uncharacterized protein LOC128773014 isoform X1 n=1 Tax=Panthera pardus TaxID=9691 RepID=A0A9W2UG90_PANPR|nr:uncharacterized protein LOC128773014 isoform X1 [Panthera pardus]
MQTWLLGACGLASPGPGTEITRPRKLRLRKRAVRGCGKGTGLRLRRAETHPALTRGRQTEKEAPTPGNSEALRPFAGCREKEAESKCIRPLNAEGSQDVHTGLLVLERACKQGRGREKADRGSKVGSTLTTERPIWGSNPQTVSQRQTLNRLSHPGAPQVSILSRTFIIYTASKGEVTAGPPSSSGLEEGLGTAVGAQDLQLHLHRRCPVPCPWAASAPQLLLLGWSRYQPTQPLKLEPQDL